MGDKSQFENTSNADEQDFELGRIDLASSTSIGDEHKVLRKIDLM